MAHSFGLRVLVVGGKLAVAGGRMVVVGGKKGQGGESLQSMPGMK